MAWGLVTVLLWSTVATAFKLSLRHLEPVQLLLIASLVSLLVMGAVLAVRGRLHLVFQATPRQVGTSLALGVLNPFLYYLVLFKAYDLLPAQEAQPLNYTWAITLTLLSIPILGQRPTWRDGLATLISYAGVVVIATRGDILSLRFASPLGVGLALGSTIIWALYWLFSARAARDGRDPVAALFLNFLFALPFILMACLFTAGLPTNLNGLLAAAYVGVFEMGVTFITWFTALRLAESASRVGNLIFISPFLSLVFIHYLVGEAILASTVWGLVCIIGGLALQQLSREKTG